MNKVGRILEIDKVIDKVRYFIKTEKGMERLNKLSLSNDKKFIKKEYDKLFDFNTMVSNFNDLPIYSKLNIKNEIDELRKGKLMDEIHLNLLKDEIQSTFDLIRYYQRTKVLKFDHLKDLFLALKPNESLFQMIITSVSNDNKILDNATPELAKIRKELSEIDKRIHKVINGIFISNKDKMMGDNYVIRNNRLVLPINTNLKNTINGVVHDISDSGSTTFIEPIEVMNLENEKNILYLKERDEVTKILENFRRHILFDEVNLIKNNEIIGELDFINAKYKMMKETQSSIPEILSKPSFSFIKAKHPLLDKDICVPNDFKLGEEKTLMLISGPNAGGKTIALKTIASLCYLTKLALPLTCQEGSKCSIFNNIFVDIGDNQSIESNLSTFSSQVSNISNILKSVTSQDLVIFDELCNGTDPKEGEALSIAITKFLLTKNTLSIISSHYPLLKKYAIGEEKVLSASFVFDERKIRPTFKLLLGVSGKSYGFLIANKFGIKQEIIDDATNIYKENYQTEELIKIEQLENKEREISLKEERLKKYEDKMKNEQSKIDKQRNDLKIKEEKLKERKSEEFDRFLDEKYKEINSIYRDFINDKNQKKALEKLNQINIEEAKVDEIFVDDYVEVKGLNIKGTVRKIKGNKAIIYTEEGYSINALIENLKKLNKPSKKIVNIKNVDDKIMNQKQTPMALNLIGVRAYEGVEMMENYISNALESKLSEVRVIHGFGTGRLREALHEALKKNKHVESFKLGDDTNGGSGSTIIKLK